MITRRKFLKLFAAMAAAGTMSPLQGQAAESQEEIHAESDDEYLYEPISPYWSDFGNGTRYLAWRNKPKGWQLE